MSAPRNRQTLNIPLDQWEALKEVAPEYGLTTNGLIYALVEQFLIKKGRLVVETAPTVPNVDIPKARAKA